MPQLYFTLLADLIDNKINSLEINDCQIDLFLNTEQRADFLALFESVLSHNASVTEIKLTHAPFDVIKVVLNAIEKNKTIHSLFLQYLDDVALELIYQRLIGHSEITVTCGATISSVYVNKFKKICNENKTRQIAADSEVIIPSTQKSPILPIFVLKSESIPSKPGAYLSFNEIILLTITDLSSQEASRLEIPDGVPAIVFRAMGIQAINRVFLSKKISKNLTDVSLFKLLLDSDQRLKLPDTVVTLRLASLNAEVIMMLDLLQYNHVTHLYLRDLNASAVQAIKFSVNLRWLELRELEQDAIKVLYIPKNIHSLKLNHLDLNAIVELKIPETVAVLILSNIDSGALAIIYNFVRNHPGIKVTCCDGIPDEFHKKFKELSKQQNSLVSEMPVSTSSRLLTSQQLNYAQKEEKSPANPPKKIEDLTEATSKISVISSKTIVMSRPLFMPKQVLIPSVYSTAPVLPQSALTSCVNERSQVIDSRQKDFETTNLSNNPTIVRNDIKSKLNTGLRVILPKNSLPKQTTNPSATSLFKKTTLPSQEILIVQTTSNPLLTLSAASIKRERTEEDKDEDTPKTAYEHDAKRKKI